MNIHSIKERKKIINFLEKRKLLGQYKKAKKSILLGDYKTVQLKIREPRQDGVYYFRINKQFRAFCLLKNETLIVFKIDNHQN